METLMHLLLFILLLSERDPASHVMAVINIVLHLNHHQRLGLDSSKACEAYLEFA